MKADRFFYSSAACVYLVLMLVGFDSFYTHGKGFHDRPIDPSIFWLDLVHGSAIALWFVLFLVQSLLITVRNRKLHMKLGWSACAIGATIACTGTLVAIRSVRLTPHFIFFGMLYSCW